MGCFMEEMATENSIFYEDEVDNFFEMQKVIKDDFKITQEHGKWFDKDGVCFTAIYHPAALLRDPGKRPETFTDLKAIQSKINEICDHTYPESGRNG